MRRLGPSEAEQSQRTLGVAATGTQCWGEVGRSGQTQQADGQVAQRGHDLGSSVFANAAAAFVKAHVAHIMQAVFNAPGVAVERDPAEREHRVGFFRTQAGDAIHRFRAAFARGQFAGVALDAENLSGVGEMDVPSEFGAGPEAPDFQTTVAFITGSVLRGGTLPTAGRRYLA